MRRDLSPPLFLLVFAAGCTCGNGGSARTRPEVEVSPTSVDFGTVSVGSTQSRMVTLVSRGRTKVTLSGLSIQGEVPTNFTAAPVIASGDAAMVIEAGESLVVSITWSPRAAGIQAARLVIESDAVNAPQLLVPVVGVATRPCQPRSCTEERKDCGTLADGCGGSLECGTCTLPRTCVGNVCSCSAETDTAFCGRLQKNCGQLTATDSCGLSRTANCGACQLPETCGVTNVCGCPAESDVTFCARLQKNCGPLTAPDSCGLSRTAQCGACVLPETCGASNVCACPSESNQAFCARHPGACDSITDVDSCGVQRTVDCGACTTPLACGGASLPNVCEHAWTAVTSGTVSNLRGIWGASANDVWAVGTGGVVLHWNGATWSLATHPLSGTTDLIDVFGLSGSNVWVVGAQGRTMHWDGTAWTARPTGAASMLHGIWGQSSNDMVTVGTSGTVSRWNGTAWSLVRSGAEYFTGVWGSAPNDLWAVGHNGLTMRWNGASWTSVTNPVAGNTAIYLEDVWGSSPSDVWAAGWGGTLLHFDGTAWTTSPTGLTDSLYGGSGTTPPGQWVKRAVGLEDYPLIPPLSPRGEGGQMRSFSELLYAASRA